jgi:hypothetical protein
MYVNEYCVNQPHVVIFVYKEDEYPGIISKNGRHATCINSTLDS